MNQKFSMKPLALALGATFALGAAAAQASMFQMSDLASGYMVASAGDAKAGEQKCGEKGSNCDKGAKAGECVCGAAKGKKADGKCGEGKCGADKKKKEGKCGEGKCGANKDKK